MRRGSLVPPIGASHIAARRRVGESRGLSQSSANPADACGDETSAIHLLEPVNVLWPPVPLAVRTRGQRAKRSLFPTHTRSEALRPRHRWVRIASPCSRRYQTERAPVGHYVDMPRSRGCLPPVLTSSSRRGGDGGDMSMVLIEDGGLVRVPARANRDRAQHPHRTRVLGPSRPRRASRSVRCRRRSPGSPTPDGRSHPAAD
jgi:hypothetical protein